MNEFERMYLELVLACGEAVELSEEDFEDITEEVAMSVIADVDPFQNTQGCTYGR